MANTAPQFELQTSGPAYGDDYAAWVEHQRTLLREHRFYELDVGNLVEEVGDLGSSAYKGWLSAIRLVLLHMLKWDYQPTLRSRSWATTIAVQKDAIADGLRESPSYRSRMDEALVRAYADVRRLASGETDLPLATFPLTCPYSWSIMASREIAWPGDDA